MRLSYVFVLLLTLLLLGVIASIVVDNSFVLGVPIIAIIGATSVLALKMQTQERTETARAKLSNLERKVSEYKAYSKYLPRRERTSCLGEVDSLAGDLNHLEAKGWLLGADRASKIREFRSRADSLRGFLDGFLAGYARKETEHYSNFFEKANLDSEQKLAVVMNDTANLVVAAAGSGKTRTLTARISYLVERGVPPEKVLALAYTNPAADEMRDRLVRQYGIRTVDVRTLHGFSRELAKRSSDFRSDVADQGEQSKIIREAAEKLSVQNREFAIRLLAFAADLKQADEKQQHDFPTAQQYYEYLRNQEYETLNLTRVKSLAEREIGNFLFLNGVEFEYEAKATWAQRSMDFRDYHPDFFLPDYDLWIEHWAIDRRGNVPDWFFSTVSTSPSERYRAGMEYKKEQFKKRNQKLLETFHYEWSEGTLIPALRKQLEEAGVVLREIPTEEILQRIDKLIRRDPLYEMMFSFISKGKTNGLSASDLRFRLADRSRKWTRKQKDFASLMIPIWQEYEVQLRESNMLDFSDMINIALQVARRSDGSLAAEHSHVLVDEFQDITDPQLELIQCLLRNAHDGNTLFCVGDHRQNIFSFAGSNVYNIIDFDSRFPSPEKVSISSNHRCPKNIVEASNAIIAAGIYHDMPAVAASKEIYPIKVIEKSGHDRYEDWEFQAAKNLLTELLAKKSPSDEVLVLARYNFRIERLKLDFPSHHMQGLSFRSIHSAKGTEADYVLVLGCIRGEHGFPSEVVEEDLLDIVNIRKQSVKERLEEERRLFYVALTRCRKQLYLFTSKGERSQFLAEIEQFLPKPDRPPDALQGALIQKPVIPTTPSRSHQDMKYCTSCGKGMKAAANYCPSCGGRQIH
jgi:DNA helicase-4